MVVGGRELIDTLWNVNKRTSSKNRRLYCELIDTLWNVNIYAVLLPFAHMRINRYIMECKSDSQTKSTTAAKELIDTLWNVNW